MVWLVLKLSKKKVARHIIKGGKRKANFIQEYVKIQVILEMGKKLIYLEESLKTEIVQDVYQTISTSCPF